MVVIQACLPKYAPRRFSVSARFRRDAIEKESKLVISVSARRILT